MTAAWARTHLRDLEDRYASDPAPDRQLERRIVETSLRFGVLCRFTAFVAADVQVVNEGGVVHRFLQPVEVPAGWSMFERVALAASAMPMARMSTGGLQTAGRSATPRGPAGPFGRSDRLASLPGRLAPGRSARRRSGGFASSPLAGADLAPYRRRATQLVTLLERPLDDLGRRLGQVRVGVEALVADLESVDAVEEELRPLRELAAELRRVTAPEGSKPPALERVREWALAVLRAFAAADGRGGAKGGEPPSRPAVREREPGRDPGFWRR